MRRGAEADCARAVAGNIAFSSGSPRPTPTPRSIVRREMARSAVRVYPVVFNIVASPSFVAEEIAINDRVNHVADSVAGAAGLLDHFVYLLAIREADRRSR